MNVRLVMHLFFLLKPAMHFLAKTPAERAGLDCVQLHYFPTKHFICDICSMLHCWKIVCKQYHRVIVQGSTLRNNSEHLLSGDDALVKCGRKHYYLGSINHIQPMCWTQKHAHLFFVIKMVF